MGQPQPIDPNNDNRETVETYNPATGKVHKKYQLQNEKEANQVIDNCHEAYLSWRETSMDERAKIVRKIGELLRENKDELAKMMAEQMGKPLKQGVTEVELCADICDYTADHGAEELASEERELDGGKKGMISYEPVGVILGMQPWNFPVYQALRYSIACIMAGNTTAFRHAKLCWGTAEKLQEIYEEAGLPENVFGLLYVDNELADKLIEHDKIRGVSYTGSAKIGALIGEIAGKNLKKTVLELGGSDPYIVLEDADIDKAAEVCVQGRINNAGQTCVAAKRFIVLDSVYDEFKEKYVEGMKAVKTGNPLDDDTDMGPLCDKDAREKLHDKVSESVDKGAKVLCGGEVPDGEGYFYPATVLENIKPGMPAYDDELFGPVASLFRVSSEEEAIELANDHKYGLGGGVFSGDEERAIRVAHKIDTGMVNVNGYNVAKPNLPFGGVKDSGHGREHGGYGLREFVNIKSIMIS